MSETKVNALLATILFAAFMLGAAVGWGGRGNEPHTAARCRAMSEPLRALLDVLVFCLVLAPTVVVGLRGAP